MLSKKTKLIAVLVIIGAALIIGAIVYFTPKGDDFTYLYYSLTCPHCKIVEEYMTTNGTESKINIVKKEVSESKDNAEEFLLRSGKCGIKMEEAGVPMLWKDGKCIVGDQPIINYFKELDANK